MEESMKDAHPWTTWRREVVEESTKDAHPWTPINTKITIDTGLFFVCFLTSTPIYTDNMEDLADFVLVDHCDEANEQQLYTLRQVALFGAFSSAWEVRGDKDVAKIVDLVTEIAKLDCVLEWKDHLIDRYEMDEDDLKEPHKQMHSWFLKQRLRSRTELHEELLHLLDIRELEAWELWTYDSRDFIVRIRVPKHVMDAFADSFDFVNDIVFRCTLAKYLHETNAFAELAGTRDTLCVDALSSLIIGFRLGMNEIVLPGNRDMLMKALHWSDFVGFDIIELIQEAQSIFFESQGACCLFELLNAIKGSDECMYDALYWHTLFDAQNVLHAENFEEENAYLERMYIRGTLQTNLTDTSTSIVLEVINVPQQSLDRGYVVGTAHLPPGDRPHGKSLLRWETPVFFPLEGQDEYPAHLDPDVHIVIGYNNDMHEGCFEHVAPKLCQMVYKQLCSHYVHIINSLRAP